MEGEEIDCSRRKVLTCMACASDGCNAMDNLQCVKKYKNLGNNVYNIGGIAR